MPISPKEVMRGSILSFEGKACVVTGIREFLMVEGRKEWIGATFFEGEPISQIWLERLGFERTSVNEWFRQLELLNWGIRIKHSAIGDWIVFQGFVNQWNELRIVKYIHQLQGLFFFLTTEHLQLHKPT